MGKLTPCDGNHRCGSCLRRYNDTSATLRMGESTGTPFLNKVLYLEGNLEQEAVLLIEVLGLVL